MMSMNKQQFRTGNISILLKRSLNGTIVGAVNATDPDSVQPNGHASLVYSIVSGNTVTINGTVYTGIFAIDPATGIISVNNTTAQTNAAVFGLYQPANLRTDGTEWSIVAI